MMDMGLFNLVFLVFFMGVAASETQEVSRYHSSDSLVKQLVYRLAEDVQQIKKDHKADITALEKKFSDVLQKLEKEKGPVRSCPPRFTARYNSSCYHFVSGPVNWITANARCRMSGAQLVSIETQEENTYLIDHINKRLHSTSNGFWTSGTDQGEEGAWIWAGSGNYMVYSNWRAGEPGGAAGQNCLLLYKPSSWKWHDGGCSSKFGYICEKV